MLKASIAAQCWLLLNHSTDLQESNARQFIVERAVYGSMHSVRWDLSEATVIVGTDIHSALGLTSKACKSRHAIIRAIPEAFQGQMLEVRQLRNILDVLVCVCCTLASLQVQLL